jgi:hypothetical protein
VIRPDFTGTWVFNAAKSSARPSRSPCVFAAIVNCGFPEAGQCRTALDILHAFARRARFNWAGGLALGEGGVIDGQSLEALGGLTRHVRTALDRAAAELAEGRSVPAASVEQVARRLIPPRVYTFMGNLGWRRRAMRNGVSSALDARPFELTAGKSTGFPRTTDAGGDARSVRSAASA